MTHERLPDPPLDHFGLLAPLYESVIRTPDIRYLRDILGPETHSVLLDVGGGTGRVAVPLRQTCKKVIVIDISPGMLAQTKGKEGLVPCTSLAERIPFPDNSFDRIVAVDSFHHFRHHKQAADELVRVLRPGGRLVIEEPDIRRFAVKLVAFGEWITVMRSRFHPPERLEAFFTRDGIHTRIAENGSYAFWLIVEKPVNGAVE